MSYRGVNSRGNEFLNFSDGSLRRFNSHLIFTGRNRNFHSETGRTLIHPSCSDGDALEPLLFFQQLTNAIPSVDCSMSCSPFISRNGFIDRFAVRRFTGFFRNYFKIRNIRNFPLWIRTGGSKSFFRSVSQSRSRYTQGSKSLHVLSPPHP